MGKNIIFNAIKLFKFNAVVVILFVLQDCIPALTLIVSWHSITDTAVTMAALQALTNLAVTSSYHSMYAENMQIIAQLALSSSAVASVRLQSMKLLVNLTSNRDMALRLLAVQVCRTRDKSVNKTHMESCYWF